MRNLTEVFRERSVEGVIEEVDAAIRALEQALTELLEPVPPQASQPKEEEAHNG